MRPDSLTCELLSEGYNLGLLFLQLKAYISHKAPEVKVLPPTAEDIINSMKPEDLPKPKEDLVIEDTSVEKKSSS